VTGGPKGEGRGNEQITIYFSQIILFVYSLNYIMYDEYHDYLLVAAAECFVRCMKWQSYNLTRCIYIRGASPCSLVVLP